MMNQLKIIKCYKIINTLNYNHVRYLIIKLKLFQDSNIVSV